MLKKIISMFLFFILLTSCQTDQNHTGSVTDILEKLQALAGVTVTEIDPSGGYFRAFQIDITQPVDHNNPFGQTFTQRLYLHHTDESLPMIFNTNGYAARANYINELAGIISSNHICVAHRYFKYAKPDPLDWQYLTIWQAASDHHHIVELFKTIYKGKWINTGGSKGGMAALFYRRYYPDDVDVTVAYVAPIMKSIEDPRFKTFLDTVGTESDRTKIREFQKRLLKSRWDLLPLLGIHAYKRGYTFSIGRTEALEYSVLEYMFAFWQYGDGDTSKIPDETASPNTNFNHLARVSPFYHYSDQGIEGSMPLYYQAFVELGYCPYVYDHLKDLLVLVEKPTYKTFAPQGVTYNFNPGIMQDVISWLQNYGNNIIYIYGAIDPWTAAAIELKGNTNALKIVQPGGNHTIRINQLDQKDVVIQKLEEWLQMDIQAGLSTKTLINFLTETEEMKARL